MAPPSRYALDWRMRGIQSASQRSPFVMESVVAHPDELCMSLQRSGVMKL